VDLQWSYFGAEWSQIWSRIRIRIHLVKPQKLLEPTRSNSIKKAWKIDEEKELRFAECSARLLKGSSVFVMHDMPIHRGYGISAEAIENPKSVIYEQAENRLYSAKAILLK